MTERLVITGFQYQKRIRELQGDAVRLLLSRVRDVRRQGSAALDLCSVAAGRADAYVEEGLHLWDRAAASLVAEEAGARVSLHTGVGGMEAVRLRACGGPRRPARGGGGVRFPGPGGHARQLTTPPTTFGWSGRAWSML